MRFALAPPAAHRPPRSCPDWVPNIGSLMSVNAIADQHLALLEPRYTNLLLNCPPNRDGLLDAAIVNRLAEDGGGLEPEPEPRAIADAATHHRAPLHAGFRQRDERNGGKRHQWCERQDDTHVLDDVGLAAAVGDAGSRSGATGRRRAVRAASSVEK